jgi:hypothetical protein
MFIRKKDFSWTTMTQENLGQPVIETRLTIMSVKASSEWWGYRK